MVQYLHFQNFEEVKIMKNVLKKIKSCLPIWSVVLFGIFFISLIANAIIKVSPAFANAVHNTIGAFVRAFLATLTSWIPFSLAEFLLILSPVLVFLICWRMCKRLKRSLISGIRYFVGFLSVISIVSDEISSIPLSPLNSFSKILMNAC